MSSSSAAGSSSSSASPVKPSSSSASASPSSTNNPLSPSAKPLISDVVKAGESERRKHARLEPELSAGSLLELVKKVNSVLIKSLTAESKTGGRVDSLIINVRKSANTLMLVKELLLDSFKKEELMTVFVLNSTNALTKLENGTLVVGGRGGVIFEWSIGQYISLLIADYFTQLDRSLAHIIVDDQAKAKTTSKDLAWY